MPSPSGGKRGSGRTGIDSSLSDENIPHCAGKSRPQWARLPQVRSLLSGPVDPGSSIRVGRRDPLVPRRGLKPEE
jgi:hypothetical protein